MRRIVLFLCVLISSALLRADFLFWLDSPTGRNNPFDPRNPQNQNTSNLPLAPGPSATGLTVKLIDANGAAFPGIKVMLNQDAAGAKTTDAAGIAAFPAALTPATVHIFALNASFSPVITLMNATGPQATFSLGNTVVFPPFAVTTTATVYHDTSGGSTFLKGVPFSRPSFTNLSFGATSTSFSSASIVNFDQVYFSAGQYSGLSFTSALFAPPATVVSNAAFISGSTTTTGWTNRSFNYNCSGLSVSTTTQIEAYGGSSWSDSWYLPDLVNFQNSPSGWMGNYAVPDSANYFRFFVDNDDPNTLNPRYTFDYEVETTSWPTVLNLTPPAKIVLTHSPTAADPHIVVQQPGGAAADYLYATVGFSTTYTATVIWFIYYYDSPANPVLDATYPFPYPTGVTLTALPVASTMSVSAGSTDYFAVSHPTYSANAFNGAAGVKTSETFSVSY